LKSFHEFLTLLELDTRIDLRRIAKKCTTLDKRNVSKPTVTVCHDLRVDKVT
jgi:hypothetical protein